MLNDRAAPPALDLSVKQAETNPKGEPEHRSKDAYQPELGLPNVFSSLETDHLWMVWREKGGDHVAGTRILIVIDGRGGTCDGSGVRLWSG